MRWVEGIPLSLEAKTRQKKAAPFGDRLLEKSLIYIGLVQLDIIHLKIAGAPGRSSSAGAKLDANPLYLRRTFPGCPIGRDKIYGGPSPRSYVCVGTIFPHIGSPALDENLGAFRSIIGNIRAYKDICGNGTYSQGCEAGRRRKVILELESLIDGIEGGAWRGQGVTAGIT